jgi:hypothetical protein
MILRLCCIIVALSALGFSRCHGIMVIDQINAIPTGDDFGTMVTESGLRASQVVTAGVAGRLSRIDLGLFRERNLAESAFIDVSLAVNGLPDLSPAGRLATVEVSPLQLPLIASIPEASAPYYTISLDFASADLQFAAGDSFSIVMRSSTNGYHWWSSSRPPNAYAGGDTFHLATDTNLFIHFLSSDAHFRTYMEIPEPASSMLVALVGVALAMRARTERSKKQDVSCLEAAHEIMTFVNRSLQH